MIFAAILLHGVCYDFLFIAGQLYVDDECTERMRGAAQGFIAFILWGIGAFVGTWLAGIVQDHYQLTPNTHDWSAIWLTPGLLACGVMVIFLLFFRNPAKPPATAGSSPG